MPALFLSFLNTPSPIPSRKIPNRRSNKGKPCLCSVCNYGFPENEQIQAIECSYCNKWFHLSCTDLSNEQFEVFQRIKSFSWACAQCDDFERCKKCEILTNRNDPKIQCDNCDNLYHIHCAGLSKTAFIPNRTECPWFCYQCNENLFPFNAIAVDKLAKLSFNSLIPDKHPNQLRKLYLSTTKNVATEFNNRCQICCKKVGSPNSAIPCLSCNCLIHKKCANLKSKEIEYFKENPNMWECKSCYQDKFPFSDADDVDVYLDMFNSNWNADSPKMKPQRYVPVPTSDEYKLILNNRNDGDYNEMYGEDFDENFDLYHSLKPDFKYYEVDQFHNMTAKLSDPFSLIHTNICSLQFNGDNLSNLLATLEHKFDVVAVTETWNPDYKKHTFQPPIINGYKPYKGTTGSSLKGGCGVYIRDDLKPLPRTDLNVKVKSDDTELETYWTEIIIDKQPNRLIGVVYPTKRNDEKCIEILNETLTKIQKENKKVLIAGDFNFDLLKHEIDSNINDFLQMMINNSYQPCITEPTRIVKGNQPSLVDNIFSNSVETCLSGNIFDKISDHLPSFVMIENVKSKPKPKSIKRRNMKNFDEMRYQADLRILLQELHDNFVNQDAENAYTYFHKQHSNLLNKHSPIEFLTQKQVELELKPWITKGILTSIRIKAKLFQTFKKSLNDADYSKFKYYRDMINSLLRKSKKQYFKNYFVKHANNIKKTWKGINNLLHKQGNTKVSDIFLNINGQLLTDQIVVADKMNKYFINVADNLAKDIPLSRNTYADFLKNPNPHSIFLTEIGPEEIAKIIKDLGINKAGDIYGNTTNLVKLGGPVLVQILTFLFNKSLEQGIFPNALKVTKIVPIHKGDSMFSMSNYRPISLLPIFSKILEKLMYSRVMSFIQKYNILYENQFGFQTGMSTEFAINALVNNIVQCLENKETGYCIFLDFAKAFDTVNHQILLKKLEYYGIRGTALRWFTSYLSDRMQCTEIGNTQSKLDYIKCGVPQGSILGPLLFLLYINDIVLSSNVFKFNLFADDTSLFYSSTNQTEATEIINSELDNISQWLAANKLSLNVGKSKLLIFNKKKDFNCDLNIKLHGQILEEVDHAKYLGVLVDNKLNWNFQINAVKLKLAKGTGLLAKIRHFVPNDTLKSLYFSFVNPYIDYNLLNWGMASTTDLQSISMKMKKSVRIICFKDKYYHSTPLFKELRILPLTQFIEFKYFKFMWKLMNQILPPSIAANFNVNDRNQLFSSISRLESLSNFVRFAGPRLWKNLPASISSLTSLDTFSKKLKIHMLEQL